MDEKMIDKGKNKDEKDFVSIKDYYKDKEISKFLNNIVDINIKKILSQLNNYIECGDWKSCMILNNKLIAFRIFKYASEEYKKQLLDILIKKMLPNFYLYLEADIDEIFELIYYTLKYITDYKIDWKFFYALLYATNSYKLMTDYKFKLFINLHHYYSEDSITLEDYKILARTFFDDLSNLRYSNAFCNFIYFFPKKYIIEDDELQLRLLYFMQNRKINFMDSCCMFHKILRKNGKLFFFFF